MLFMLGTLYYREARYDEAGPLIVRALELDPRHPDQWAKAISSIHRAGDPHRAVSIAEEGIMLFPGQLPILSAATAAALDAGDFERTIRYGSETLDILEGQPDSNDIRASTMELMGDAYMALGEVVKARQSWSMALEENPNLESVRRKLASAP
jgi:tetratricopeptide (TPR) repeat protein